LSVSRRQVSHLAADIDTALFTWDRPVNTMSTRILSDF
jgi:hypothetical protein